MGAGEIVEVLLATVSDLGGDFFEIGAQHCTNIGEQLALLALAPQMGVLNADKGYDGAAFGADIGCGYQDQFRWARPDGRWERDPAWLLIMPGDGDPSPYCGSALASGLERCLGGARAMPRSQDHNS